MPAWTDRQIAVCIRAALELLQSAFDAVAVPGPPRLMLATWILPGTPTGPTFAVTHSMPQMTVEVEPEPVLSRTFTAYSAASGATPTTPMSLSRAATMP